MSKAAIDRHFPRNGPCMFHPTRYARHRVIDAIKGRHKGGDSVTFIAWDMDISRGTEVVESLDELTRELLESLTKELENRK